MDRKELISSPEYWTTGIQVDLYNAALRYMRAHDLNRAQLAERLGVSRAYVTQLLNGDYDHKLSKLVELALSFGCVPDVKFTPIEEYLQMEQSVDSHAQHGACFEVAACGDAIKSETKTDGWLVAEPIIKDAA